MKFNSLAKTIVLIAIISGFLFSCVPSKKFEDVMAEKENREQRTESQHQKERA